MFCCQQQLNRKWREQEGRIGDLEVMNPSTCQAFFTDLEELKSENVPGHHTCRTSACEIEKPQCDEQQHILVYKAAFSEKISLRRLVNIQYWRYLCFTNSSPIVQSMSEVTIERDILWVGIESFHSQRFATTEMVCLLLPKYPWMCGLDWWQIGHQGTHFCLCNTHT